MAFTSGDYTRATGSATLESRTSTQVKTDLGLTIGTNVQAYSAILTAIAALATTDGGVIVGNGSTFVLETGATARTSLGLTIGTNVQAQNATLQAIATAGQQSHVADASTSHSTASFGDVNTALDNLGTIVNSILSTLETTGLHATS